MAIFARNWTILLLFILGCSLLNTKAQDEAPAEGEGEETAPAEGGEETAPAEGGEETAPAEGGEETAPAEGGEETAPAEGGEETAPAEGGEETAPAEGGEETAPAGETTGEETPAEEGAVEGDTEVQPDGGAETQPQPEGETDGQPETGAEDQPQEGDTAGEGDTQPAEGDTDAAGGETEAAEGGTEGDGEGKPAGGEETGGETDTAADGGGEEPAGGTEEGEQPAGEGDKEPEKEDPEPKPVVTTEEPCEPTAHWKVSSLIVPPYLQEAKPKNSSCNCTDNEEAGGEGGDKKYEGYIVDLLDGISRELCVTYEIALAADGKYGSEKDGEWTGIIGDVVKGTAEIGAGPITVTLGREKAVDFTIPIYSFEAVGVRYRPPGPSDDLQLSNTNDLLENEFKFGVLKGSPIARTLEISKLEEHKKLWDNIKSHNHGQTESNNKGIERARRDEKYAFLIEGSTAEWVLNQPPCDLTSTPTGMYKRKYAFAVANQSPLRDQINEALTELQISGKIQELRSKWWPQECNSASSLTSSLILLICAILFKYYL